MLTDDDLTRQLGGAFREAAADLAYAGRVPAPRSAAATWGVPLASTAAVATTLAVVWTASTAPEDAGAPRAESPATSAAPVTTPRVVTRTVEVAGFTFSYRSGARAAHVDDLYVQSQVSVPADATRIDSPEGTRAWVGVDPASGDHALYVEAPTRNDGRVFAVLSPTWTRDQLVDLFRHGDRP
ncbi:hypothetical protein [Nocardioides sp.]|uniref:hypothetical protein n=1 Tax=Nocardioides sp. TaxID=35761 RepID=UPI003783F41A